ncbi:hypothetical protein CLU79DRAFT_840094 [Phycomyces nitens]|nr:hypothetical protein CLU79DRAFT_840094 [Phycomyces nitens]
MSTLIPFGDAFITQLFANDQPHLPDTPVDSASLSSLLASLYKTTDALHEQLINNIYDNVDIFSASYEQINQLTQRVGSLTGQVITGQSNVIDPHSGTRAVVGQALERYTMALETSQKHQTQLDSLSVLVSIVESIQDIESLIGQGKIVQATSALIGLQDTMIHSEPHIVDTLLWLQDKRDQQKKRLVCVLEEFLAAAVTFGSNCMTVQNGLLNSTEANLKNTFECLDQLQLLTVDMSGLKRSLFKNIIQPFLEPGMTIGISSDSRGATLSLETREGGFDPLKKLEDLGQILDFCFQNLFGGSLDHASLFGKLAIPELFGLVIQRVLGPAIPTTSKDLGGFDVVSRAAQRLEQTAREHFGSKENGLSEYVKHLDRHFARKRGEKVLSEGRSVMLRRLYEVEDAEEGTERRGTETHHYRITQTPQLLVLLLTDMIQEASGLVNTHPISAAHLVHATADLLDLYRAIMPSYHRAHLVARPANCLVFRNDCFWIASQLEHKLAQQSSTRHFPELAGKLCEEADKLRLLGSWWARLAVEQRMHRIDVLLERLDGFTTIADHRQRQQCEEAIGGIVVQIKSFSEEARPVLDSQQFLDTMAGLVNRLLDRLIKMIEDIVDIGAEESELISRSLNSMAQLVSAFDVPGHDADEQEVIGRVENWQKFWLLKEMLDMTMKDIMEAWRRGALEMFATQEMSNLVCALFADTDRREAVLDEIKTGRAKPDTPLSPPRPQPQPQPRPPPVEPTRSPRSTDPIDPMKSVKPIDHNVDPNVDLVEPDEQEGWGWDEADENLFEQDDISEPMPDLEINTEEGWGDADEDLFVADDLHK